MSSCAVLSFHFLSSNLLSQKETSRVFINKVSKENYEWKFIRQSREINHTELVNINSKSVVIARIRAMLNIIQYDKEPFDSISIYFPGFPCVRITMEHFSVDCVMETVNLVFDNWTICVS